MLRPVKLPCAALAFAAVASSSQAASWICDADDAVGYYFENEKYKPTIFDHGERYLLRPFNADIDKAPRKPVKSAPKYVGTVFGAPHAKMYFWASLEETKVASSMAGPADMTFFREAGVLTITHHVNAILSNARDGENYTPTFSIAECVRTE